MKIALLATDTREHFREYDRAEPGFGTAPAALLQGFGLLPEVEVEVISCVRQPVRTPVRLAANTRHHAVVVPKLGWMTTGYQGCIRAVRRKLRELRPDIVHGQGTERDCAISAVFSGFPNVLTIHGNMRLIARVNRARPFSYPWLNAHLEAFTLPRTGGIICITDYTRQAVNDLARRTWLVPNAVDAAFFEIGRRPDAPALVLCVGVVCHRKNQIPFIRAIDSLAAERKFRLVFLGALGGEPGIAEEFQQLIASRPWCEYAGEANRTELRTWLARASLLALPSLEDNCPMVVLEAMAAGVPVLAAEVGGLPDLVEDRVTGVFCDPADAPSMAAGVRTVLEDAPLARRIAGHARDRALTHFHPRVIATRHVEIYRELLSTRA